MADEQNSSEVKVNVDTRDGVTAVTMLQKEFKNFSAQMVDQSKQINEKLQSVGASFEGVKNKIAALVAGGSFAAVIREANEFAASANKLSKMLGITLEASTQQVVALKLIGMETEQYTGLLQRMTLQVRNNETRLNALGVATRGAGGALLDSQVIMQNAAKTLLDYKVGTDRNLVATELFGRNWVAVLPILRLTDEMMKRAKTDTEELGLTVSKAAVEDIFKFKVATAEMNLVMEGIGKVIAEDMLPRLTKMATFFREHGPEAISLTKSALSALHTVVDLLVNVWQSLVVRVLEVISLFTTFVELLNNIRKDTLSLNFSKMVDHFKEAAEKMKLIAEQSSAQIDDIWKKTGTGAAKKDDPANKDGKSYSGKDKTSVMTEWKEQLQQMHLAEQNLLKDMTQDDLAFWQEKLGHTKAKSKEWYAVQSEIYGLQKKLAMDVQAELRADEQLALADTKNDKEAKVKLTDEWAKHQAQVYGADSKEYKAALREKLAAEREMHDFLVGIRTEEIKRAADHADTLLEMDRMRAKFRLESGQITARQEMAIEAEIDRQQFENKKKALAEQLLLLEKNKLDQRETKQELLKLEDDYAKKVLDNQHKIALQQKKLWDDVFKTISDAFATSIKGMILGTTTLQKALSNIWTAILGEFISKMIVEPVTRWLANKVFMMTQEKVSLAEKLALQSSGAAASAGIDITAKTGQITRDAATTFAGVFSFLAPMMGPFAAGPAAVSAAEVMAQLGALATPFEVGSWNIPGTMLGLLHPGEMVVSKPFAQGIRENGGMGMGGGSTTLKVDAVDAESVAKLFMRSGHALQRSLQRQVRNMSSLRSFSGG